MDGRYDMYPDATFSTPALAAERVTAFLRSVYGWMCGGLAITALTATFVASSPSSVGICTSISTRSNFPWETTRSRGSLLDPPVGIEGEVPHRRELVPGPRTACAPLSLVRGKNTGLFGFTSAVGGQDRQHILLSRLQRL